MPYMRHLKSRATTPSAEYFEKSINSRSRLKIASAATPRKSELEDAVYRAGFVDQVYAIEK